MGPDRKLSRRAVLISGGGVVVAGAVAGGLELVQHGVLPGKYVLANLDGACGSAPPPPRGPLPAWHALSFYSRYRHRTVTMVTLIPPGLASARGLGVVVMLHGAYSSARSMAPGVGAAMATAGIRRFAAVAVDGGDTYWHEHADGDDPLGMIVHEVLPRLAAAGAQTSQIGLVGESMGGYGALLMAEQLTAARGAAAGPRPAAVGALSPAIFATYADARAANRGAFDSQAEFDRNDVFTGAPALRTVPVWICCGADDPFEPTASQMMTRLASLTGRHTPGGIMSGCHDGKFFARNMPSALTFVQAHLD